MYQVIVTFKVPSSTGLEAVDKIMDLTCGPYGMSVWGIKPIKDKEESCETMKHLSKN